MRQERSAATVDIILVAAAQVLGREGPSGFNTNRVAEVAGVSIGSLYQYFPGKEALLAALARRHDQTQLAAFEALVVETRERPLDQAIELFVTQFISGHLKDIELHSALHRVPHLEGASAHEDNLTLSVGVVADVLSLHARDAPKAQVDRLAWTVVHLVDGLTHQALVDRPADLASGALGAVFISAVHGALRSLSTS